MGLLDRQVGIVTGGGRGIGRAVASELAAAGAAVAVVARTERQVAETAAAVKRCGGRALGLVADVRDVAAVRHAVDETERHLGPITLLVNNAGTAGPRGSDWEIDPTEWWECVEVSLRGAFLCNHVIVARMIAHGGGRVVHMASTTGTEARPTMTATSVAKTALIRLTEGLALSGRPHGVYAFAINPGAVDTDLLRAYKLDLSRVRLVPPERAAALCVRLASGACDMLSGRFLDIDDDVDELMRRAKQITDQDLLTLRITR